MNAINQHDTDGHDGPTLLTLEEARLELRISRWKLFDLMNRREIRAIRIGARRLIPTAELDRYVEQLMERERQDG